MKRLSSVCMSLFFIAFLAVAGTGSAFAQEKASPEQRAKQMTDKMKTDIPLEEGQYTKVYDINLKYIGKMKDIRQQTTDRKEAMQSMQALRKEKNDELSKVLSEEQMKKYREMQKEMRQTGKDRRKNAREK